MLSDPLNYYDIRPRPKYFTWHFTIAVRVDGYTTYLKTEPKELTQERADAMYQALKDQFGDASVARFKQTTKTVTEWEEA